VEVESVQSVTLERSEASEPKQRVRLLGLPAVWVVLAAVVLAGLIALGWLRSDMWKQTGLGVAFWAVAVIPVVALLLTAVLAASLVRSRLQFGLRSLLVAFTIIGVGLGWLGMFLNGTKQQRACVARLVAAGADVGYSGQNRRGLAQLLGRQYFSDADQVYWDCWGAGTPDLADLHGLKRLTLLWLVRTDIADGDLADLEPLSTLRDLSLAHSKISRDALTPLQQLPCLRSLCMADCRLEDGALAPLSRLTPLQDLDLRGSLVDDEALQHVKRLMNLTQLDLGATKITDDSLVHLKDLTQLETLTLGETQITDAGLQRLRGLEQLRSLELQNTQVGDAGMQHIAALTGLERLNLFGTLVSNAGLKHLEGLTRLRELNLAGTRVTDDGAQQLRQKLPNCQVLH